VPARTVWESVVSSQYFGGPSRRCSEAASLGRALDHHSLPERLNGFSELSLTLRDGDLRG